MYLIGYLPLGMRRRSWCSSFALRCLFWWPIMYVCKFKTRRYQTWTSVIPWKCIGLVHVRENYSWKMNSQPHSKCWLVSSRRNREKTLNIVFSELNNVYLIFYIFKVVSYSLIIKQTQRDIAPFPIISPSPVFGRKVPVTKLASGT